MIAFLIDAGLVLFGAGAMLSAIAMACRMHSDEPNPYPEACAGCMLAVFLIVAVTV